MDDAAERWGLQSVHPPVKICRSIARWGRLTRTWRQAQVGPGYPSPLGGVSPQLPDGLHCTYVPICGCVWFSTPTVSRTRDWVSSSLCAGGTSSTPIECGERHLPVLRNETSTWHDFHHKSAPDNQPGQDVWLSMQDLPLQTKMHRLGMIYWTLCY